MVPPINKVIRSVNITEKPKTNTISIGSQLKEERTTVIMFPKLTVAAPTPEKACTIGFQKLMCKTL